MATVMTGSSILPSTTTLNPSLNCDDFSNIQEAWNLGAAAEKAFAAGDVATANGPVVKALDLTPRDPYALINGGLYSYLNDKQADALRYLREAPGSIHISRKCCRVSKAISPLQHFSATGFFRQKSLQGRPCRRSGPVPAEAGERCSADGGVNGRSRWVLSRKPIKSAVCVGRNS
jgi:hypothetical protein